MDILRDCLENGPTILLGDCFKNPLTICFKDDVARVEVHCCENAHLKASISISRTDLSLGSFFPPNQRILLLSSFKTQLHTIVSLDQVLSTLHLSQPLGGVSWRILSVGVIVPIFFSTYVWLLHSSISSFAFFTVSKASNSTLFKTRSMP